MASRHENGSGSGESAEGITFSLENGIVLASWSGKAEVVLLGPVEAVTAMMADFLAQTRFAAELMDRVANLKSADPKADEDSTDR